MVTLYRRLVFDCEILLIANCEFPELAIKRIAMNIICDHAPSAQALAHVGICWHINCKTLVFPNAQAALHCKSVHDELYDDPYK